MESPTVVERESGREKERGPWVKMAGQVAIGEVKKPILHVPRTRLKA